jgi:hypothetical protein
MQLPFMFIDFGRGLESVTDHTNDVAALASFNIRWGTSSPDTQPEPSVLTFSLHDRTGSLAGKALSMAGARVILQLATPPRWRDLTPEFGTWNEQTGSLANLHQKWVPPAPDSPDSTLITIFDGIVSSGGTITEKRDNEWTIALSATGRMVLWKRMQAQGPTDPSAKYKDLHWVGSPTARFNELNSRASKAGAPLSDKTDLSLPPTVAAYSTDFPSQLDLLHRLFSASPRLPLWYETPDGAASILKPLALTDPVTITARADATLVVNTSGNTRPALNGDTVEGTDSLEIPSPLTLVKINAKRVKANDNVLEFDDAGIEYSSTNLPENLTATQSSMSIDSDALIADESAGVWSDGTMLTVSDATRTVMSSWIYEQNLRLRPESITVDARKLDPATWPWLYVTAPTGAFIITGTRFSTLTGSDGNPAFTGAWTSIGGTLSFAYNHASPILRHELTLLPLLPDEHQKLLLSDLTGWPATYEQTNLSIAELSMVDVFETN